MFYSGLKLAECRLLTSAVRQELTLDERDMSFREAVSLVLGAMHSRPLNEGADLHYIAAAFLSQVEWLRLYGRVGYRVERRNLHCQTVVTIITPTHYCGSYILAVAQQLHFHRESL